MEEKWHSHETLARKDLTFTNLFRGMRYLDYILKATRPTTIVETPYPTIASREYRSIDNEFLLY